MRWSFFACLLLLSACPPSLRRPESSQLVLTGSVYAGGFSRRAEPLTDAQLTVRRADTGEELASNGSSSAGGFRFQVTVSPGSRVVLLAEAPGFAPAAKAFVAGPYTEVTTTLSLEPLTAFECVDTGCVAPEVELWWEAPDANASGQVASFALELEPPVQVDVDDTRPAVLALGFARTSGTGGRLALRVPLARWSELVDARPGTGALEVDTATFDPATGTWTRGAPVELETESGLAVPESALPSLQRLEFAGGAVAPLPVVNGRFVAVLAPRAATGCVTGTVTAEGQPARGVSLMLPGIEPVSSDERGAFCASAELGNTLIDAVGQYAGLPYAFGAMPRPTMPGTCGGTCRAVGEVSVRSDALVLPTMCKLSGRVIDTQGTAIPGAEVVGFDDSIAGNSVAAFCGKTGTRCSLAAPSGADGSFTLNVPLAQSALLAARVSGTVGTSEVQRRGGVRVATCPTDPVTLKLQRGEDRLEVTASFLGDALTWLPPRAAARVTVLDGAGLPKWELVAPGGLLPPLTYGVVPAGATETVPRSESAASGDTVMVELEGVGRDGVVYLGVGSGTRP